MTRFDKEKLIEAVLYILNATQGIDYYHVFKILYFAQQKHLCKWGSRLIGDEFVALQYGPVPTELYNAVNNDTKRAKELSKLFAEAVEFAGKEASNTLLPLRYPNMDYLSQADIESLDQSIKENKGLSFGELKTKSHDKAWEAKASKKAIMHIDSIAAAAGASKEMIAYINEQEALQNILA